MSMARALVSAKGRLVPRRIWKAAEGRWYTIAEYQRHLRWERFKATFGLAKKG